MMETTAAVAAVSPAGDEPPRVKILCTFGGMILPRPLDGLPRHVGGQTRIVAVPRDISYCELLARMQDLFDGAAVIKYQQPDEDLDALVSVLDDDDVTNMMEEYDKVSESGGDGLTKLRVFLYPHARAHEMMAPICARDDRETEQRYVDALNGLPDTPSPSCSEMHDQHFSPGSEFLNSSASSRYRIGPLEVTGRIACEHAKPAACYQLHHYECLRSSPPIERAWLPPGAIVQEKVGFPCELGYSYYTREMNGTCEHCINPFRRKLDAHSDPQYFNPRTKHGHLRIDQQNLMNYCVDLLPNSCPECYRMREHHMLNQAIKLDNGILIQEQNEHHYLPWYNDIHGHEKECITHKHRFRQEDARIHHSRSHQFNEPIVDGNTMKFSSPHGNARGSHLLTSSAAQFHGQHCLRDTEVGNEVCLDQHTFGDDSDMNMPNFEEAMIQRGNQSLIHGVESLYHVPHNLSPIPSLQRKAQASVQPAVSHELMSMRGHIPGLSRNTPEGGPKFPYAQIEHENIDNSPVQNNISNKILAIEETTASELLYCHGDRLIPSVNIQDIHVESPSGAGPTLPKISYAFDEGAIPCNTCGSQDSPIIGFDSTPDKQITAEKDLTEMHNLKQSMIGKEPDGSAITNNKAMEFDQNGLKLTEVDGDAKESDFADDKNENFGDEEISEESLSFLPDLIASVKKTMLEGAQEVIVKGQPYCNSPIMRHSCKKQPSHDSIAIAEVEGGTGDDNHEKHLKVEPTTTEAKTLTEGLQTIMNDDLEEMKKLGSGTFGSVYHGKWRGSDVAIKRIKTGCFDGRSSERERLIEDFWKEARTMSLLHHPNIVCLYGVVCDGPDESLATVTEFMVNGSLKQALQKKDRTIDRRKRLIIAMDISFGMEYLHSKNIVHFDLKCENLLVNMRDPLRPICKIGDLGLSKIKQCTMVSGGIRGTLPWIAPELLSGKSNKVSEKIDVYSFGIVMWELLTGEEPYADMRGASIIGGIVNNTLRPKVPAWCDPEWKSLMQSCWSTDPALRPSFSEISKKFRKMAAAINLK